MKGIKKEVGRLQGRDPKGQLFQSKSFAKDKNHPDNLPKPINRD